MSDILSPEEWVAYTPFIDPTNAGAVARWDRLRDHDKALRARIRELNEAAAALRTFYFMVKSGGPDGSDLDYASARTLPPPSNALIPTLWRPSPRNVNHDCPVNGYA